MGSVTVGSYLIERLAELGVRHVFGIPGDYVLGFYGKLEASELAVVNCADEQGAGFAADASWRLICPYSDPGHVLLGHTAGILVLGLTGFLLGYLWSLYARAVRTD